MGVTERDQEAERRQEAEQKVPHGRPRAPTVTSGSACLPGRHGTGRGLLGSPAGAQSYSSSITGRSAGLWGSPGAAAGLLCSETAQPCSGKAQVMADYR